MLQKLDEALTVWPHGAILPVPILSFLSLTVFLLYFIFYRLIPQAVE